MPYLSTKKLELIKANKATKAYNLNSKLFSFKKNTSFSSFISLKRANTFIRKNLKDFTTISTFKLGKEVYNLRDKDSNKVIGYLGYLVAKEKLASLSSFIANIGLKANNSNFIIIIYYALENKYYSLTIINSTIREGEWLSSTKEISKEFTIFKNRLLGKR